MKKFKVKASYVVCCEATVEAQNEAQAYEIALEMSGDAFDIEGQDGFSDWLIDSVDEIKEIK
jgi:hypothetical protein